MHCCQSLYSMIRLKLQNSLPDVKIRCKLFFFKKKDSFLRVIILLIFWYTVTVINMGCCTESLVLFTKYHLFKLKYVHVVVGLKEEELCRQTILSLPFATVMWRAIKMKPHLHNQYQNNHMCN